MVCVNSSVLRKLMISLIGQQLASSIARAQDGLPNDRAQTRWAVALGGGAAVRPTYEGSNRYVALPVPLLNLTWTWADAISIGTTGVNASWHHGAFSLGGGLLYDGGRRDTGGSSLFREGDERLRGLGNISGAVGANLSTSYGFGPIVISGSVTQFTGSRNDGVLASLSVSNPYQLTQRLTMTLRAAATWEDRARAQTFFGVTAIQAANSKFLPFTTAGGIKDVTAGIDVRYQFDRHWFLDSGADVKELEGDAARSPITFARTNVTARILFGYHF